MGAGANVSDRFKTKYKFIYFAAVQPRHNRGILQTNKNLIQ